MQMADKVADKVIHKAPKGGSKGDYLHFNSFCFKIMMSNWFIHFLLMSYSNIIIGKVPYDLLLSEEFIK